MNVDLKERLNKDDDMGLR